MENGEKRMENGENRMENGEKRMENGEKLMENGENRMERTHVVLRGEMLTLPKQKNTHTEKIRKRLYKRYKLRANYVDVCLTLVVLVSDTVVV